MFQFHHVNPDTKHPSYTNLMKQVLSLEQIDELDKCTLLCTQCHAIIHAQEIAAKLEISVELENRVVSQHLDGWIKADVLDKTLTFVTNQRILLQPCEVRVGDNDPVWLCVIEIERDDTFLDWLRNISQYKVMEVLDSSRRHLLMQIEHAGERRAKITQAIGFPVTAINLSTKGNGEDDVWLRHGILLTKAGKVFTTGTFTYQCDLL